MPGGGASILTHNLACIYRIGFQCLFTHGALHPRFTAANISSAWLRNFRILFYTGKGMVPMLVVFVPSVHRVLQHTLYDVTPLTTALQRLRYTLMTVWRRNVIRDCGKWYWAGGLLSLRGVVHVIENGEVSRGDVLGKAMKQTTTLRTSVLRGWRRSPSDCMLIEKMCKRRVLLAKNISGMLHQRRIQE